MLPVVHHLTGHDRLRKHHDPVLTTRMVPRGLISGAHRLAALALGLMLATVLSEVGLRAAALVAPRRVKERTISTNRGQRVVLCVGDSHTYGVFCPAERAYPGQLQRTLDVARPGAYRVYNLGLPGMNSAQVRSPIPNWLDRYRPSILLICIGANNVWNESDPDQASEAPLARQLRNLRIYRLARLVAASLRPESETATSRAELNRTVLADGQEGVEHRDAATGDLLIRHQGNIRRTLLAGSAVERLRSDLGAIRARLEGSGVRVVLLGYAACRMPGQQQQFRIFERLTDEMVLISEEQGWTAIDPRPRFRELLHGGAPRTELYLTPTDSHPNARGYSVVAALAADAILETSSPGAALGENGTSHEPVMSTGPLHERVPAPR